MKPTYTIPKTSKLIKGSVWTIEESDIPTNQQIDNLKEHNIISGSSFRVQTTKELIELVFKAWIKKKEL